MNLKEQFQEKTVMPAFSAGGFAVTPIIRQEEPKANVQEVSSPDVLQF